MAQVSFPFTLPGCQIDQVHDLGSALIVEASANQSNACCPACQTPSHRIHSRYTRLLRDLPVSEQQLRLIVRVRRFFCDHPTCPKRTFAEPLPELVPVRAQRTLRLSRTLETLGFALGGEAGARLSQQLRMPTSPSSVRRIIRQSARPAIVTPRVVGVDDFALRRGRVYATILVDLERRRPIDLLPDRSAATLAAWLRDHPGIDVITRDRSTEYTRGATEGAPTARQIVDRWHVLLNLREALERMLNQKYATICQLPAHPASASEPVVPPKPRRIRPRSASETARQLASHTARLARQRIVRRRLADGMSLRAIAQQLKMSRTTVRLFAATDVLPERATFVRSTSMLDPYAAYLQQRWQEGCYNGSQLWREIQGQGYAGELRHVLRWLQHLRTKPTQHAASVTTHDDASDHPDPLPAPRRLVWLLLRKPTDLQTDEHNLLRHMCQDPQIEAAYTLAQQFQRLIRTRQADALTTWIDTCSASGSTDLQTFATGLRRDEPAIRNAIREPWSNGPVEGHVNRLKMIKRQMYGRASFDLLRQRVLHAP